MSSRDDVEVGSVGGVYKRRPTLRCTQRPVNKVALNFHKTVHVEKQEKERKKKTEKRTSFNFKFDTVALIRTT